jgi:hypothetical protein
MDYQRETYDPPGGVEDPGRWLVHLALHSDEVDEIRRAAPAVVPAERFELRTELLDGGTVEGEATLAIYVMARTAEEATAEAEHLLRKMRREAGLADRDAAVLGYISPWWGSSSRGAQISREAMQLLKDGRDEWAVIRIQTSCELNIAQTLSSLITDRFPDVDTKRLIRRPASLADHQTRELLHLVTGKRIQDELWWPRYVEHLQRRNAILHDGVAITHEDAQASVAATIDMHRWLLEAQGVDLSAVDEEL